MAPKEKKKNGQLSSSKKDASGYAIPWPNLPQQLLHLIGKQLHLMKNIGCGGVSKSWRVASKKCSSQEKIPWLQLSDVNQESKNAGKLPRPHTLNIPHYPGCYCWQSRRPWPKRWMHILGCSHGVVVSATYKPDNFCVMVDLGAFVNVSNWDINIPFRVATLSTFYGDPKGCKVMVATGISSPAFLISGFGWKSEWIKHDCLLVDPYDSEKRPMKFTNAIGFKGKFYALSLQGSLALIEEVDSQFRITGLGRNRAVPSVSSRHFLEYLIESDGEILLIFLISRKSINVVDDAEVFRLDLSKLLWVKMESLSDRTLFLGPDCSLSLSIASQVGCQSNSVYFTHQALDGWLEYDMLSGSISPWCKSSMSSFNKISTSWGSMLW